MKLSSLDLNLLVVLHALLETQSVKLAAKRLGLSPSATSHALGRLRGLIGDPLLVRSGRQMTRTPRAERLRPTVARWASDTERLLSAPDTFDPATAQRSFSLGTNDYVERVLVLPLSARIWRQAPGVDLHSKRIGALAPELRTGALDLAIGVPQTLPADITSEVLYRERHVCLLRPGHPALAQPLTPARYAALSHILVAPHGTATSYMDRALEAIGLSRRISRMVATFSVAPHLVMASDHILTLASRMARPAAAELGLIVVDAPIQIEFGIAMAWHKRMNGDPAHEWLRAEMKALVSGMDPA